MGRDNFLCVKCGGYRYTPSPLCRSCREEEAENLKFPDSCPWSKGDSLEMGFPCGSRYVDLGENGEILQYVPGSILKELNEEESIDMGFESGDLVREKLREIVASETETRDYDQLTAKCLDCPEADWDEFAGRMSQEIS